MDKPWYMIPITIPISRLITIGPFVVGDTGALEDENIAHEQTHIIEQAKLGFIPWFIAYATNKSFRKEQELKAFKAEVKWLRDNHKSITKSVYFDKLVKDSKRFYGVQLLAANELDEFLRG